MITLKKIESLKPRLQARKIGELARLAARGEVLPEEYYAGFERLVLSNELFSTGDAAFIIESLNKLKEGRLLSGDDIYYKVLEVLKEEPADWDFLTPEGKLDGAMRRTAPHALFLDMIRSPFNLGSIFRSAESFKIDHIYIREGSASLSSPRCLRTARGAIDTVPHSIVSLEDFHPSRPLFALELGGETIENFDFPSKGIAVIGSEETGVSPELLELCEKSLGRVSIAQYGAKGSINVSVASGILMHAWAASCFG